MNRFFSKRDLTPLWEEDGDLQRMKAFFQTIEADSEGSEQIKQSVKQKVLEKMARMEDSSELHVDVHDHIINEKKSLAQRIRMSLLTMSNFGRWKLGISVVALAFFVIIGQEALNGSGRLFPRLESTEKLAQSVGSPPQAADSNGSVEMGGEGYAKQKTFSDNTGENEGAEPKTDSLYTMDNSSAMENKATLPVPPDQADAPPDQADALPDQADAPPDQADALPNQADAPPDQADALLNQADAPPDQVDASSADSGVPRKITHDLELTLEVAAINESVAQLSQEAEQLGGYVVTSQQSESDYYSSAQLTLKIPADKLSGFQDSFPAWGKVLDQRLQANDITNQYYDSQARLQILEAEEKRYLEILNQATSADDVLKVKTALSDVRQQIEQLKGQLKLWDHQVDYSTVTLQIVIVTH